MLIPGHPFQPGDSYPSVLCDYFSLFIWWLFSPALYFFSFELVLIRHWTFHCLQLRYLPNCSLALCLSSIHPDPVFTSTTVTLSLPSCKLSPSNCFKRYTGFGVVSLLHSPASSAQLCSLHSICTWNLMEASSVVCCFFSFQVFLTEMVPLPHFTSMISTHLSGLG